jgi:hypothetical protein
MRRKLGRLALGAVGLLVGVVAVLSLREATLSTHEEIEPGSEIELVVSASTKNAEPGQTMAEMVEAQILTCRLEVTSDVVGEIEALPDNRFRAVLTPSMDDTNRRQFRGCVEDWFVDQVRLDVISLEEPDVVGESAED